MPHPNLNHDGVTTPTRVKGVCHLKLLHRCDQRGPLAVLGQDGAPLPFVPKRLFLTYEANRESRGGHAHRRCQQILLCASGSVRIRVKDGINEEVFTLDSPREALWLGPMIWAEQFDHSEGTVLLVLASDPYDDADYIRKLRDWMREVTEPQTDEAN